MPGDGRDQPRNKTEIPIKNAGMDPPNHNKRGRVRTRSNDNLPPGKRLPRSVSTPINQPKGKYQSQEPSTSTSNQYDILPDDDDMSSIDSYGLANLALRTRRHTRIKTRPEGEKPLLPPIIVQGVKIQQMREYLKNMDVHITKNVVLKITADSIKLLTSDSDAYAGLKQFCIDNKLSGYTFTPKQDRYIKICMYGLWDIPMDEITAELKDKGVCPDKIKTLTLKKKRYEGETIFLLYFKKSQQVKITDLRKITGLFNVVVRFQYYKNQNNGPTQCSNCQKFGHGTQNCLRPAACVRCAGAHSSTSCPLLPIDDNVEIKKIPDDKVKCALCGENHTANYRQCKIRLEYKEQKTIGVTLTKRNKPPEAPAHRVPRRITDPQYVSGPTYAQIVNNSQRTNHLLPPNECLKIFDLFVNELLKCHTVEEQIRTIAKLSFEQVTKYLKQP